MNQKEAELARISQQKNQATSANGTLLRILTLVIALKVIVFYLLIRLMRVLVFKVMKFVVSTKVHDSQSYYL